ncbi:hypothetical protein BJV78DRAFT_1363326 [Lactifluus subvellereus]|nr:hypothetical protein BJV78DRAFT_1363326 [Lactifluus subvellereus]
MSNQFHENGAYLAVPPNPLNHSLRAKRWEIATSAWRSQVLQQYATGPARPGALVNELTLAQKLDSQVQSSKVVKNTKSLRSLFIYLLDGLGHVQDQRAAATATSAALQEDNERLNAELREAREQIRNLELKVEGLRANARRAATLLDN